MKGPDYIPDWADDRPNCPRCYTQMDYVDGDDFYKCPCCEYYITADTYFESVYGFSDPGEKPVGCVACGGPWPACKTSCSMYDD